MARRGAGARAGRAALGGCGALLAKVGRPRLMRWPWARGRARVRAPDGLVERRARPALLWSLTGWREACVEHPRGLKSGGRVEEDEEDESQPHRLNSPGPAVSLSPFTSSALLITRRRSSVLVQLRELAARRPPQPESRFACPPPRPACRAAAHSSTAATLSALRGSAAVRARNDALNDHAERTGGLSPRRTTRGVSGPLATRRPPPAPLALLSAARWTLASSHCAVLHLAPNTARFRPCRRALVHALEPAPPRRQRRRRLLLRLDQPFGTLRPPRRPRRLHRQAWHRRLALVRRRRRDRRRHSLGRVQDERQRQGRHAVLRRWRGRRADVRVVAEQHGHRLRRVGRQGRDLQRRRCVSLRLSLCLLSPRQR